MSRCWLALVDGPAKVPGFALELPYHLTRPPDRPQPRGVYVLADSLAAGLGTERTTWPKGLAERTGVKVHDLSAAGATTDPGAFI